MADSAERSGRATTITARDVTDRRAAELPAVGSGNELARRYLALVQRWIPVGVDYFTTWDVRPDCGHFFGGAHWYGQETVWPAETFALAALAEEYDESATGVSRAELRRMALAAVRYLCFTHDTGPPELVRPAQGLGRPENCNTKWGERGKGFFRESQCGTTIAGLARICLLLRDEVDEETWMMVAAIHADYLDRFSAMPPRNGVYWDTQMEENGWTASGLTSCYLFLERHEQAAAWEEHARRWMFSTCAAPEDARDQGLLLETASGGEVAAAGGARRVRDLAGRTFTALPDLWAENHGMVHPNYTASGVHFSMIMGCQLALWGRGLPPELLWNRRRIYQNLKAVTDRHGYPQPVQGMDWHYLPAAGSDVIHAIASVYFDDPDAAALQRQALCNTELRQAGNGGRLYDADFAARAHDQQDPMIMREITIQGAAKLYLFHRLFGAGAEPTPDAELERRLAGVRVFPHAGFVHHRHQHGQTALSWRNAIMALPLPRDGLYVVSPSPETWLGRPVVDGCPDSQRARHVTVNPGDGWFAALLVIDRCQGALRQEVLCASLPDGRMVSFERFVAQQDLQLQSLDQGMLSVTNETFPRFGDLVRGTRVLYLPDEQREYRGWLGAVVSDDQVDDLGAPPWLNVDDRIGLRFQGSGAAEYHNRHYFQPYRAIADDLTLSRQGARRVRAGEVAGHLAAVVAAEQHHDESRKMALAVAEAGATANDDHSIALVVDGFLVIGNVTDRSRTCIAQVRAGSELPLYAGTSVQREGDALRYRVAMQPFAAQVLPQVASLQIADGDTLLADCTADGVCYLSNAGSRVARVHLSPLSAEANRRTLRSELAPGQTLRLSTTE